MLKRFIGAGVCALGFAAVVGLAEAAAQTANSNAPNVTLAPTYGTIDWRAGFGPDPYAVRIAAGGSLMPLLASAKSVVAGSHAHRTFASTTRVRASCR